MEIKWNDLEIGDEIIIPYGRTQLAYLKVLNRNKYSFTCSIQKKVKCPYNRKKSITLQPDTSKHDRVFHLKQNNRDIWLIKRKNHGDW